MLNFLFELVLGEETKYVGPCGTCGAIRVGAVSALFAPNAKRRGSEHRGPSAFYDEIDGGWYVVVVCLCVKERELNAERHSGGIWERGSAAPWSQCGL